jgi:hypothetical protein
VVQLAFHIIQNLMSFAGMEVLIKAAKSDTHDVPMVQAAADAGPV